MRFFSFRTLLTAYLLGSFIPLLLLIGLIVYGFQRTYLIQQVKAQLSEAIRSEVENSAPNINLSLLAIQIGERIRSLGADLFIKDQFGNPVPPALGTGPWLDQESHQDVLLHQKAQFITLHTSSGDRIVFMSPILSPDGRSLGTLESSISLTGIQAQLSALQRWLIILLGISILLVGVISQVISTISLRPIEHLVQTAEQVREGNLSIRAKPNTIIEINALATTINQMLDRLEKDIVTQKKLNEAMRRFAADASHELRSPLMVFNNSVDLIKKLIESHDLFQSYEVLSVLDREVQTMTHLVDNLLLLARLDQAEEDPGKMLNIEIVEPFPLLEEVFERARLLAQGQKLVLKFPNEEIKPLSADRNMLTHALNNLIENALHYTPAGKQVFVTVHIENNNCAFIIQDEGPGIPAEQIPYIFERFYRVDFSRSQRKSGAGLGLAIVESIVRLHHGKIEITSEVGKGTAFKVLIPYLEK